MSEPKLSDDILAQVEPHDHEGPTTKDQIQLVNWGMAASALEARLSKMEKTARNVIAVLHGYDANGRHTDENMIEWLEEALAGGDDG